MAIFVDLVVIFPCQDLVDIDVFQEARRIIEALQNKDVAPALAWCADNKSRLKKSKVCTAIAFICSMILSLLNLKRLLFLWSRIKF